MSVWFFLNPPVSDFYNPCEKFLKNKIKRREGGEKINWDIKSSTWSNCKSIHCNICLLGDKMVAFPHRCKATLREKRRRRTSFCFCKKIYLHKMTYFGSFRFQYNTCEWIYFECIFKLFSLFLSVSLPLVSRTKHKILFKFP